MTAGNTYLGETITAFALTVTPKSLTVFSIKTYNFFTIARNKIRLSITEVLLFAIVKNLMRSKNIRYWVPLNAILLPQLLTKTVILDVQHLWQSSKDLCRQYFRTLDQGIGRHTGQWVG